MESELSMEINQIDGFIDNHTDSTEEDKQLENISNSEIQNQVKNYFDKITDSVPKTIELTQDEINENQVLIEKQLNLENDLVLLFKNKEPNSEPNNLEEIPKVPKRAIKNQGRDGP